MRLSRRALFFKDFATFPFIIAFLFNFLVIASCMLIARVTCNTACSRGIGKNSRYFLAISKLVFSDINVRMFLISNQRFAYERAWSKVNSLTDRVEEFWNKIEL